MTATSSSGLVSEIAIAARSPAAPPPISSTSCDAIGSSLTSQLLVDQNPAAVVHHPKVDAAVVELLLRAPAAAGEPHVLGGEPLQVLGVEALTVMGVTARSELRLEPANRRRHGRPPRPVDAGADGAWSQPAPVEPGWEGPGGGPGSFGSVPSEYGNYDLHTSYCVTIRSLCPLENRSRQASSP